MEEEEEVIETQKWAEKLTPFTICNILHSQNGIFNTGLSGQFRVKVVTSLRYVIYSGLTGNRFLPTLDHPDSVVCCRRAQNCAEMLQKCGHVKKTPNTEYTRREYILLL